MSRTNNPDTPPERLNRNAVNAEFVAELKLRICCAQPFLSVHTEDDSSALADVITAATDLDVDVVEFSTENGWSGGTVDVGEDVARIIRARGLVDADPRLTAPRNVLRSIQDFTSVRNAVFVLWNFHELFGPASGPGNPQQRELREVIHAMSRAAAPDVTAATPPGGTQGQSTVLRTRPLALGEYVRQVIFLSYGESVHLHPEVAARVHAIEYGLPTREEIRTGPVELIVDSLRVGEAHDNATVDPVLLDAIAAACSGMGRTATGDMLAYSASMRKGITPDVLGDVRREKAKLFARSSVLSPLSDAELVSVDQIGGMGELLEDVKRSAGCYTDAARLAGMPLPRGILLMGLPGCLHGDTPIFDPTDGTTVSVRDRYDRGTPFSVVAMDESGRPVVADAWAPQRFEPAEMLELTYDSDETIKVTLAHQIRDHDDYLTAAGVAESLQQFGPYQIPTSSELVLSALRQDARRSTRTTSSSAAGCSDGSCLGGGRLPRAPEIARVISPSPGGVRVRTRPDSDEGDPGKGCTGTRRGSSLLPPRRGWLALAGTCKTLASRLLRVAGLHRPSAGLTPESVRSASVSARSRTTRRRGPVAPASTSDAHTTEGLVGGSDPQASGSLRVSTQSRTEACQRRTSHGFLTPALSESCGAPCNSPVGYEDTQQYVKHGAIVKAVPCGAHEYFDFHVPHYNNYWAVAGWHHNTGKSMFARAAGRIFREVVGQEFPVVKIDVGAIFAKHVGESEANWRNAKKVLKVAGPCAAYVDEVHRALGGMAGGVSTDSGVGQRVFGDFLSWCQDRFAQGDTTYLIFTLNNPKMLSEHSPEFFRRVDQQYFVDLPNHEERKQILKIHLRDQLSLIRNPDTTPAGLDLDALGWEEADYDAVAAATADFVGDEIAKAVCEARKVAMFDRGDPRGIPTFDDLMGKKVIGTMKSHIIAVVQKDELEMLREACKNAKPVTAPAAPSRAQATPVTQPRQKRSFLRPDGGASAN